MKKTVGQQLGDIVRRMLGTPFEHEAISAALALRRAIATHHRDYHEIAARVENVTATS